MCNCVKEVRDRLKQAIPDASDIIMPIELLTGRVYLTATKVCEPKGQQRKERKTDVPLLLSKCPWCGEKYPEVKNNET